MINEQIHGEEKQLTGPNIFWKTEPVILPEQLQRYMSGFCAHPVCLAYIYSCLSSNQDTLGFYAVILWESEQTIPFLNISDT